MEGRILMREFEASTKPLLRNRMQPSRHSQRAGRKGSGAVSCRLSLGINGSHPIRRLFVTNLPLTERFGEFATTEDDQYCKISGFFR